jgi:hypothetical protein
MLIKFTDAAGNELQPTFEAGAPPAAGEIVVIKGKEYEVTKMARNVVQDESEPPKMVRTVVLRDGPKATPAGAKTAHGKKELLG